ncbi:MAG: 6-bladed beta-propeller [Candidatus Aminicenantales bacterium]
MKFHTSLLKTVFLGMIVWALLPSLLGKEIRKISLEEVLSIGDLEDDLLFQWTGVTSDTEGFIYVTDNMDYSLKKFSASGKLQKKTGQKGQGPGEFSAPRLLDCSEKWIYVIDQNIPGIQVFDKELHFQRRIPMLLPVIDFKVLSDDRIAVLAFDLRHPSRVLFIDPEGKITSELDYSRAQRKNLFVMADLVSFDVDAEGNVYLAYTYEDRIEKWTEKGRMVWSKKLLGIKKVKSQKAGDFVIPTEIVYKDVALDRSGNIFILGGHFSKNRSRDVYVLSPSGELRTTFSLPDFSHCIYIDKKNFLYSRAQEGITLKKFKMKYN